MSDYRTDLLFHHDLLELLARRIRPKLYIEIGVASGACIRRVAPHCERAIGVDIERPEVIEGFEFVHGSSEEFLENVLPETPYVELALIDGDHRHVSSLRDFELLLPSMRNDGVILLHDTYPASAYWIGNAGCGDTYLTAEEIGRRSAELGIEVMTLPTPPGVTLVRKRSRHLDWLPARRSS